MVKTGAKIIIDVQKMRKINIHIPTAIWLWTIYNWNHFQQHMNITYALNHKMPPYFKEPLNLCLIRKTDTLLSMCKYHKMNELFLFENH